MRTKMEPENNDNAFLTVEQALDLALEKIKDDYLEGERIKIYVWRQRYRAGKLSHKKIQTILEMAGFSKAVEEKWILIDKTQKKYKKIDIHEDGPFVD